MSIHIIQEMTHGYIFGIMVNSVIGMLGSAWTDQIV